MPEQMKNDPNPQRARLIEDVRRLLYENMKQAEQAHNWELFTRYADFYLRIGG